MRITSLESDLKDMENEKEQKILELNTIQQENRDVKREVLQLKDQLDERFVM